jgi:hypothetical protein
MNPVQAPVQALVQAPTPDFAVSVAVLQHAATNLPGRDVRIEPAPRARMEEARQVIGERLSQATGLAPIAGCTVLGAVFGNTAAVMLSQHPVAAALMGGCAGFIGSAVAHIVRGHHIQARVNPEQAAQP